MKPIYIQIFYEGCPEVAPMIGTQEYPVYLVGWYSIDGAGNFVYDFPFPPVLSLFEGRMVNIWTSDLETKIIRNVKFSKKGILLTIDSVSTF